MNENIQTNGETTELLKIKINGQEMLQTYAHELKLFISVPNKKINVLSGIDSNPVDFEGCPESIIYQRDNEKLKITCNKCRKEINIELGDCYNICSIARTVIKMFNDFEEIDNLYCAKATFINPIVRKHLKMISDETSKNISHNFTIG